MLFCTELTLLTWKRRKVPEEPQRRSSAHWKANGLKNKVRLPVSFLFFVFLSLGTRMATRFRTIHKSKISKNIDFLNFWSFFKWFFRHEEEIFQVIFCGDRRSTAWRSQKSKTIKKSADHGEEGGGGEILKNLTFFEKKFWPWRDFENSTGIFPTQKYLPHTIKSKIWPLHQKLWSNLNFCRISRFLKMASPVATPPQ